EKLCYGICAGSVNLVSHPIQTAESLYKIPEGLKEGWNQFKDGNWTQRVEIATEAAGIAAMLVEAGVRIKNARNAGKASAEMEGILAEDAGTASGVEGAGASELTEDMCRLVEKYKKLCEEEQWSMNKNTGCFLAGTKVSTPEGMRNIEEIMVGEEVYAENTATGKSEKRKVTRISQQKTNIIVYLQVNGSEICSTMEHPFRHKEKGWVKAEELLPGDFLKQRDGEYAEITYIRQRKEEKEQWVYNLEVEGLHSYYVAGEELLVHNGEGVCPGGDVKIESAGKYSDRIKWGIHDIEVRPEGKGFWGRRINQNNPRVEGYELKINPNNESYYLPHPNGGFVQFENMINSTVQDGKLIMKQKSFYHVNDLPDFAKNKVLLEAQRQLDAAAQAGYNVEWLVSDVNAANQLRELFKNKNMDIKITYYPE
ncbi:MAG: hypothetical protein HFJ09_14425, partial [Lachnospiraceae bacterium]|nr:hypothetical protein [Lachnospiraceae bacterium]